MDYICLIAHGLKAAFWLWKDLYFLQYRYILSLDVGSRNVVIEEEIFENLVTR